MRKMKPETKKLLAGGLAVFLAFIFILSLLTPFLFGAESGGVEISAQVGIDGTYRVDSQTPVNLIATNQGSEFTGEVQIRINISYDENNPLYVVYSYPLELANGASKSFTMDITIPSIIKSIAIDILDKNGKEVGVKDVPVKAVNTNLLMAGLLCDSPDSLNYIMAYSYYSNYYARSISVGENLNIMDASSFPQNLDEINAYSIIIINDFDTSTLSEEQKKLLSSWVTNGGRLIIGTGQNYEKIKSGFNNITLFSIEKTGETDISSIYYKYNNEALSPNLPVITCDYSDSGAYSYAKGTDAGDDEYNTCDAAVLMSWGDGDVITTMFDLGTHPVSESSEINTMLNELISDRLYLDSERNVSYNYNNNDLMYSATGELKRLDTPLLPIAFIVLFLYVLAVSPLLYFFLKKMDKRDFSWIIIPGAALVTILLIFGLSLTSGYRNPVVNAINVVKLSNGQGFSNVNSTVGFFSPDKGDVKVAFDNGKGVKPIYNQNQFRSYGYSSFNPYYLSSSIAYLTPAPVYGIGSLLPAGDTGKEVMRLSYGAGTEITYFDKSSWSPDAVNISQDVTLGELAADLRIEGGNLAGTIENKTGMDFDEIVIGFGYTYFRFSNVSKGEILEVNENIDVNPEEMNYYDAYSIADKTFPRNYSYYANISEADFKLAQFSTLFRHTLQLDEFGYIYKIPNTANKKQSFTFDVNIFAFNDENLLDGGIKINNAEPTVISHNIFYKKTELNLLGSENFVIPYGMIGVSGILCETKYDENVYDNSVYVYGGGEISFVFDLPTQANINSFYINASKDPGKTMLPVPLPTQIYNVKNDEWEQLRDKAYNIDDYVYDNSIVVKYITTGDSYVYKPAIKLMGGGAK